MTYRALVRLGAICSISGGLLRVLAALFTFTETTPAPEVLYFVIDVLLLFGLMAIYLMWAERLSSLGLSMFALSTIALASLVGPNGKIGDWDQYLIGASALSLGLAGFSLSALRVNELRLAAYLWLASFASGLLSMLLGASMAFLLAGILFGLGFITAGVALLRSSYQMFCDGKK